MEWTSILLVFCVALTSCSKPSGFEERLLELHNRERAERGLEPLALSPELCDYSQRHATKMAEKGRLVHSSMSDLATEAGNGNVGENIAWGQRSEEEATDTWMDSPGHRQNILGKRFRRAGFGMKRDKNGRPYWCAVFSA